MRATLVVCAAAAICVLGVSLLIQSEASPFTDRIHHHAIVIMPTFTIAAYQRHGFYDYYRSSCSLRCLTVPLNPK